ncbi:MAG: DNA repair protein RadA [Bacteroidales bacterium]|nr:DNA repair protein RadA [Bacteroidales bacterium]
MSKSKRIFVCQNCGAIYSKWLGKCSQCNSWNSVVEESIETSIRENLLTDFRFYSLHDVPCEGVERFVTQYQEFNRVLGGGLVPGSFILLGGEPGIGKSTLLLQVALHNPELKCLYVSGEESLSQIKIRSERLGSISNNIYISNETNVDQIIQATLNLKPTVLIVDSIQTVYNPKVEAFTGSLTQIRQCANDLQRLAKENHISVFLIGHITKDGMIAGPKLLEHMVDVVLQFEGDEHYGYRILRTLKNRFGPTNELGIFEMTSNGLREISNPSEILLSHRTQNLSGTAVACTIQGIRPLLVEVQALVSSSAYGNPQRTTTGFDPKRLNMILAVLEKRLGMKVGFQDVFLNITGGLRIDDPALDLGVACSIISSHFDFSIPPYACFTGEIGLTGEIRPVDRLELRVSEAIRIGFKHIYLPLVNLKNLHINHPPDVQFIALEHLKNLLENLQT